MDFPEELFERPERVRAVLQEIRGERDPRKGGAALVAFLEQWRVRFGDDSARPTPLSAVIAELQAGLDELYSRDLAIARLEDELDMLRLANNDETS